MKRGMSLILIGMAATWIGLSPAPAMAQSGPTRAGVSAGPAEANPARDGRGEAGRRGQGGQRGSRKDKGERSSEGSRTGSALYGPDAFITNVPAHDFDIIPARPTRDSITLSILSYKEADGRILYGASGETPPRRTEVIHLLQGEPQNVVLPQLTPDTEYKYRLQVRESGSDGFVEEPERSFHTQRPPDAPFVFAVQADSHLDLNTVPPLYTRTMNNIAAEHPDFLVDLGDTFMTGKYGDEYTRAHAQYLAQRYYFGLADGSIPLFLTLGNHDGENGGRGGVSADSLAVWANAMRKRYFPNPVPDELYTGNDRKVENAGLLEDYYAWRWGDALFVVLDPFWPTTSRRGRGEDYWNWTLGEAQYGWLRKTLEGSKAQFKFVFIHHLVGGLDESARGGSEAARFFEWGGYSKDGRRDFETKRPGWDKPIHALLVENKVAVVFHGHDHFFAKQDLDGIVYQLVPQPGYERYGNTRSAEPYGYVQGVVLGGPGHMRVSVSPDKAVADYVLSCLPRDETESRKNGAIAYSYSIDPR